MFAFKIRIFRRKECWFSCFPANSHLRLRLTVQDSVSKRTAVTCKINLFTSVPLRCLQAHDLNNKLSNSTLCFCWRLHTPLFLIHVFVLLRLGFHFSVQNRYNWTIRNYMYRCGACGTVVIENCTINRKVVGSRPDEMYEFFSIYLIHLGFTNPRSLLSL
jgi:hypothetical protein